MPAIPQPAQSSGPNAQPTLPTLRVETPQIHCLTAWSCLKNPNSCAAEVVTTEFAKDPSIMCRLYWGPIVAGHCIVPSHLNCPPVLVEPIPETPELCCEAGQGRGSHLPATAAVADPPGPGGNCPVRRRLHIRRHTHTVIQKIEISIYLTLASNFLFPPYSPIFPHIAQTLPPWYICLTPSMDYW